MTYFLRDPRNRLIKIGKTSRLAVRLRQLAFEFGTEFEVLGVVSEEKFPEIQLHRLFRKLRSHREFFIPDPVLLRFIKEHAVPWEPSWDAPGGHFSVPVDRFVRWQLKEVAESRGITLEQLVDELLRAPADEMFHGLRQGVAVKS